MLVLGAPGDEVTDAQNRAEPRGQRKPNTGGGVEITDSHACRQHALDCQDYAGQYLYC